MKKLPSEQLKLLLIISSGLVVSSSVIAKPSADRLEQEAKTIVKQFASQLKPKLKQAMMQGGPMQAVEVCAEQAPKIAQSLSLQTGWQVRRVSLNNRNSEAVPNSWERQVLSDYESQLLSDSTVKLSAYSNLVDGEYRFMKPQLVEPLCLTCHGTKIEGALQDKIHLHYPNDKAMGYQLGQIRGAFSLSKKLAE